MYVETTAFNRFIYWIMFLVLIMIGVLRVVLTIHGGLFVTDNKRNSTFETKEMKIGGIKKIPLR